MTDTSGIKWDARIATSGLHKMLRAGNTQMAIFCAAYLNRNHFDRLRAWRRVLAFPSEDLSGEGVRIAAANYTMWKDGYCDGAIYDAIASLCSIVQARGGQLNRAADELKCAAIHWNTGGRKPLPVLADWRIVEPMPEMLYVQPYAGIATFIYQSLARGEIEPAAHAAAYLFFLTGDGKNKDDKAYLAAWRPVLHLPFTHLRGMDTDFYAACYTCFQNGHEHDNWYAAALNITKDIRLFEEYHPLPPDEVMPLRQQAEAQVPDPEQHPPIPPEALDMHTGHGSLADFWTYANALGPASPWRDDAAAMHWPIPARYKVRPQAAPKSRSSAGGSGGQLPLQQMLLRENPKG